MARFILETDDLSGQTWAKKKKGRLIISLRINAGNQMDHPSRRTIYRTSYVCSDALACVVRHDG